MISISYKLKKYKFYYTILWDNNTYYFNQILEIMYNYIHKWILLYNKSNNNLNISIAIYIYGKSKQNRRFLAALGRNDSMAESFSRSPVAVQWIFNMFKSSLICICSAFNQPIISYSSYSSMYVKMGTHIKFGNIK